MVDFDAGQLRHLTMLCAAASVAGFVRGFTGFGGPATVSLLLVYFFTPATLLPKIALLDFYAYPMLVYNVRRDVRWGLSLPLALVTVCMMPIGLHTMTSLDPEILKRMIGAATMAAVLVTMTGYRFPRQPPLPVTLLAGGCLGWILASTFIALPLVTYILLMPFSAAVCRATFISVSLIVMPSLIAAMFYRGMVQVSDIAPVAAAGLLYLFMTWLGTKAFSLASDRDYRRAAQWLLLVLSTLVLF